MSVPSAKGLLLMSSISSINQGLEAGLLSRDQLEVYLEPGDLELLEAKIDPTHWYPIASLGRMTELMANAQGGDRAEVLRKMGAKSAEAVRAAGTYRQMSFEKGSLGDASVAELKSFIRQTVTIHTMFFNFGSTRIEIDPNDHAILVHYREMSGYPEVVRLTSEGYTSTVATWALGRPCRICCEQLRPDGFTFRYEVD